MGRPNKPPSEVGASENLSRDRTRKRRKSDNKLKTLLRDQPLSKVAEAAQGRTLQDEEERNDPRMIRAKKKLSERSIGPEETDPP